MSTLNTYVHVADEAGRVHVFGPGDVVPDWAARRITNRRAWAQDTEAAEVAVPDVVDEPDVPGDDTVVDVVEVEEIVEEVPAAPPRSGPGSGREVWRAYAQARGIDVPADATQKQIITAVDARG